MISGFTLNDETLLIIHDAEAAALTSGITGWLKAAPAFLVALQAWRQRRIVDFRPGLGYTKRRSDNQPIFGQLRRENDGL